MTLMLKIEAMNFQHRQGMYFWTFPQVISVLLARMIPIKWRKATFTEEILETLHHEHDNKFFLF
jgi:hypothetical protein